MTGQNDNLWMHGDPVVPDPEVTVAPDPVLSEQSFMDRLPDWAVIPVTLLMGLGVVLAVVALWPLIIIIAPLMAIAKDTGPPTDPSGC